MPKRKNKKPVIRMGNTLFYSVRKVSIAKKRILDRMGRLNR